MRYQNVILGECDLLSRGKMYKIIVWGLGRQYNSCLNLLKMYEEKKQIEICAVTDRDGIPCTCVDGYTFVKKTDLKKVEFDYIIICSDDYFFEIMKDASEECEVSREKILSYKIMSIPYFSFDKYIELHKRRPSIVSNNCWGGILYNSLYMECRSPFKNVSINEKDYIKLVSNFGYYMSIDPVFNGKSSYDSHIQKAVPILQLGDIEIKENHELDPYKGISDWIRRREKINYSEIVFEMYAIDKEIEATFFSATDEKTTRICFVPYDSDFKYSHKLVMNERYKEFYEAVNDSAFLRNPNLDILDLLIGSNSITRYK